MATSNKGQSKNKGQKAGPPIKPLPVTNYPRGKQGTFVYSPDISVYVQTDNYGVIDLSRYITTFTIQRQVNAMSTFMCSFDNKFARFDRVIGRMDRIVVFMKRMQWVQVFAGYVSVAPWQTIVPGDASLQAQCTIKRLQYTYWDPTDPSATTLFPVANDGSATPDGGSAATMFRLLTHVSDWDPAQIQIQRLPDKWLEQAVMILRKSKDEFDSDTGYQQVKQSIIRLLDADGWQGVEMKGKIANSGVSFSGSGGNKWLSGLTGGPDGFTPVDQAWHKAVGKKGGMIANYPPVGKGDQYGTVPDYYSGFIPQSKLTNSHVESASGQTLYLRVDAASSLESLSADPGIQSLGNQILGQGSGFPVGNGVSGSIKTGYLGYGPAQRLPGQNNDQKTMIQDWLKANHNNVYTACANVKCPAGTSDHGWGIAIDFNGVSPDASIMNKYGWIQDSTGDGGPDNSTHWVFVGNYPDFPAYTSEANRPASGAHAGGPTGKSTSTFDQSTQFNWHQYNRQTGQDGGTTGSGDPAFKSGFFVPQFGINSALGARAWINNVPLIDSIASYASSSLRDFQSAPNGDFVAYFPDRLGIYGKFPAMSVRDIEIIDFKLIIQDTSLVTHYASVGDYSQVADDSGVSDGAVFFNSGTVSVEQDDVMAMLLGIDLKKDQNASGLGQAIMDKFGIRPKRDDNAYLFNFGYNYMMSLHRFQEAWASQWQALVQFTFMPEIFPGMRIELADKGVAVYVESVVHSGSRTGGFVSNVTVSSPMRRQGNTWVLLNMEFNIKDYIDTNSVVDDPIATKQESFLKGGNNL